MKLNKLTTAIVGVMMTAGMASSALAEPSPNMTPEQRLLFSCTEQTLSIIAAITDATNCTDRAGNYDYQVVAANGLCTLYVEDDYVLTGNEVISSLNGTQIVTTLEGKNDIDGVKVRQQQDAGQVGEFLFSGLGEIMVHSSDFDLKPPPALPGGTSNWEPYDEHVIKDYFAAPVFGSTRINGVRDNGLEAITKEDALTGVGLPRAKWREQSRYQQPDHVPGLHTIVKKQTVIDPYANYCTVRIRKAAVSNFSGGLYAEGTIEVRDY
jgi:hypothetical protein